MATNLPPEPVATERELLESPEQWSLVSVGLGSVMYMDRRGRTLVLQLANRPYSQSPPSLKPMVKENRPMDEQPIKTVDITIPITLDNLPKGQMWDEDGACFVAETIRSYGADWR